MFKVAIKSNLSVEVKAKINKLVNAKFVEDLQREVVDGEIVNLISAGVSPVRSVEGNRRFAGYKSPDKYPGKKKAKRPANLQLSGVMLLWYLVKSVSGLRVRIGIPGSAPKDVKDRALANNEGTMNSQGQVAIAARRFIPLPGETYAVSVVRKMKSLYAKRIKEIISSK